eukprot:CAMPEP_0184648956 /NCGR_PEP_ID=MMETSP0308-20130426/6217_1 /TAXON_ID=38269 /ORGANISM="Gloeochaete witrockiana, Strain SAG 46.84" /LENGTH=165 /DNA_ID=CAMNT_0027081291 /DNA_START=150 /DNA_END=647 /DNA_ORIENTATION=+
MGVNVAEVYVDTVGDPARYEDRLRGLFPSVRKIVVAKKADSLYAIVSAASICAKVNRDTVIKKWSFEKYKPVTYDSALGSGYPADPTTKEWLEKHLDNIFGYPDIVRFSWSTVDVLCDNRGAGVIWDDDEEGENKQPTMMDAQASGMRSRDRWFKLRRIDRVNEL